MVHQQAAELSFWGLVKSPRHSSRLAAPGGALLRVVAWLRAVEASAIRP